MATKTTQSEREFFGLAGTYLACRFLVFGHRIPRHPAVTSFKLLEWPLLGMADYQYAMRQFCESWRVNPEHSERHKPKNG